MKRIGAVIVLVGLVAMAGVADGDRVTRGTVIQTTDAVVSKRTFLLIHSIRRTDTALPPYLVRFELQLPSRARVRTASAPRCGYALLQAKGPLACPARSRVGSGSATGRTLLDPKVGAELTIFNGKPIRSHSTVVIFFAPELGPHFAIVGTVHMEKGRARIDFLIPTIKILAGTGPDAVISDFALRFEKEFLTAPCPARYRVTSHFFSGFPRLSSSDRARCK